MESHDTIEVCRFLREEASDPTEPLLKLGTVVGSWTVIVYLGGGGFGEVYRVRHRKLGIVCALKILKRADEASRVRFLREASVLAQQSHSGFPRFYELGEYENHPFIVMEMLLAFDLPCTDRAVAALLHRVCEVVDSLHAQGLVHRDIKPSNILVRSSGEPVLIDYGLVKSISTNDTTLLLPNDITKENLSVGTLRYAAPEQLTGGDINVAVDIHALGVLVDVCFKSRVPRSWRWIVRRATSSLPEQRFKSVRAFDNAVRNRFVHMWAVVAIAITITAFLVMLLLQQNLLRDGEPREVTSEGLLDRHNSSDAAYEWL